jgi:hypothetical protein
MKLQHRNSELVTYYRIDVVEIARSPLVVPQNRLITELTQRLGEGGRNWEMGVRDLHKSSNLFLYSIHILFLVIRHEG